MQAGVQLSTGMGTHAFVVVVVFNVLSPSFLPLIHPSTNHRPRERTGRADQLDHYPFHVDGP